MEDRLKEFRRTLQERRREMGFTQQELSKRCGFSASYIGKIERGEKDPSLFAFLCIAEELTCSPGELLSGSQEGEPDRASS